MCFVNYKALCNVERINAACLSSQSRKSYHLTCIDSVFLMVGGSDRYHSELLKIHIFLLYALISILVRLSQATIKLYFSLWRGWIEPLLSCSHGVRAWTIRSQWPGKRRMEEVDYLLTIWVHNWHMSLTVYWPKWMMWSLLNYKEDWKMKGEHMNFQ